MKSAMGDSKVIIPAESKTKRSCVSRPAVTVLVVCLAIIVIGGVVLTAVYVGGKLSKDKEGWVTFRAKDGRTEVQKMTVSDVEEEVYVPGVYHVVFDFQRSLLVLKDLKDHSQMCMLLTFNTTKIPKPQEMMDILDKGEYRQSPDDETVSLSVTVTKARVDNSILSEKARMMCKDQNTVWAIPSCSGESDATEKRIKRSAEDITVIVIVISIKK